MLLKSMQLQNKFLILSSLYRQNQGNMVSILPLVIHFARE
ncbi:hypothetical protein NIES2104_17280 [Leptolyngbya sp. NIES-2104]|nr:hypothetical protein NIES2104_17280 [Leptolyngbya sp. NIES-2104]